MRLTASAPPQVSPGQQLLRKGAPGPRQGRGLLLRRAAYQDLFAGKRVVLFGLPGQCWNGVGFVIDC